MLKKAISYEKGMKSKNKSVEYELIHTLKQNFSIVLLCELAGDSRREYYKWEKRINFIYTNFFSIQPYFQADPYFRFNFISAWEYIFINLSWVGRM